MAETEMKIDLTRAAALLSNLQAVQARVTAAAGGRHVRLVAVSKLKPANDILALHQSPAKHEHFGENYAQELAQKAELLPRSVKWHFIGGLQSGHCKNLARIPNLWAVSSVGSVKHATLLNKYRGELIASSTTSTTSTSTTASTTTPTSTFAAAALTEISQETIATTSQIPPLNIHIQVNTSGESSKSGTTPGPETIALCRYIVESCPHLRFLGLMTIGAIARSMGVKDGEENEDFVALGREREDVVREVKGLAELELSMGMSEDFEAAIVMGSSEVRVGSTIFGVRGPKGEAKVVA